MPAWDALLRPELAAIAAYVPSHPNPAPEAERRGEVTKLDANEAPLLARPKVVHAVRAALAELPLERYPDARATELRERLARHTGASADEILVGTGSDEIIALLVTALARPRPGAAKARVLTFTPSFVMYAITARAHGLDATVVPLDDAWDIDVAMTEAAMRAEPPNIVFIASPNNPTGNRAADERLLAVIEIARAIGAIVVLDEAYVDFSDGTRRAWRDRYDHLVVLRTLSKVGLAALRVGWLEGPAALVREIDKVRQPYNVSATSQAAAAAVLAHAWDEVALEAAVIARERTRVTAAIAALPGYAVTPSEANFVWVRAPQPAVEVAAAMRAQHVLVRAFGGGGGGGGDAAEAEKARLSHQLRITIGTPAENERLLRALAQLAPPKASG
jgi:histidinol-phosphate aminotransferase